MEKQQTDLRRKFQELLSKWQTEGLPARNGYAEAAKEIISWKKKNGIGGLWAVSPILVTATIDDGWGHGLRLIEMWAEAAGMKIHSLGLMKTSGEIIEACRRLHPDFFGMTVLQFDSEETISEVAKGLPEKTRLIAGGPVFHADPELAKRTGIHMVAKHAADFLSYLLALEPGEAAKSL
jgi:hypothetical protein